MTGRAVTSHRGICSVCRTERVVRRDGKVAKHLHPADYTAGGIFRAVCDGSGEEPA